MDLGFTSCKLKTIMISLTRSTLFLLFGFVMFACTPKSTEPLTKPDAPEPQEEAQERLTPCKTFDDLRNRDEIETAFVLYRDQMKMNKIKQAYPLWQKAMHRAPGSNGRIQTHYEDGLRIFKHFFDEAKDSLEKRQWLDSIDWVYAKRAECFGDEAYLAGRRAFDYYYYYKDFYPEDTIYRLFKTAIDGKGKKTDYFVVNPFVKLLNERYNDSLITEDEARHYAYELLNILEYGNANCKGNECEAWAIINDYAPNLLDNFEGIEDFYDCNYYTKKYYQLFLENKDNCDIINEAYRRMRWGKCDENLAELVEIRTVKDSACYVPPPAPGPLKSAFIAYNDGKYREAINRFNEFINSTDDPELKAKYLLLISKIYYGDIRNFPEARKYALRAADWKPNWGEPFILIGKLYASSGPICGPGRGWDSQIVTWAAIDKFEFAKKIDSSVSNEANKLIREYSKYMPSIEDIFLRTFREGESFLVPCWIQERTVIRAAKK